MVRSILLFVLIALLTGYGCGRRSGKPVDNQPPDTRFANVPPDSSQIPYRVYLHWYGNDPDGFVIGYEYAVNDSSEGWTWVDATEDTIDLPAPNLSDLDSIWVRAMDDDSARDPTPAMRYYTATTIAPETYLLSGYVKPTVFSLPDTTSTWHGIVIPYTGEDFDGEVVGYRVRLTKTGENPGDWSDVRTESWMRYLGLLDGEYTFEVKAVDNAEAEDPSPAEVQFRAVARLPGARGSILVIDETRNGSGSIWDPNDAMVDSFYRLILDQSGCYVYEYDFSDGSLPDSFTHDTLADIGLAIYHSDEPQYVPNIDKVVELLREYLDVGGKLWLVGYRNVARLVEVADTLSLFAPGQFLFEHLGLEGATSSGAYEFVGALSAAAGYETLEVDPAKLRPGKPGMMYADALAPRPEGTRVIYQFQSSDTSSTFQDQPCAMLHDRGGSSDSKVALFGFGLYQMKVDSLSEPLTTLVDSLLEWFDVKPE